MLTSNARIICASNCSLRERVRQGKFREDLYQRLTGLTLLIPPLRERLQELPASIVESGWIKRRQKHHGNSSRSDGEVASPSGRGNLRELSHTVRAMTLFCNGSVILPEHVVFPPDLEAGRDRHPNEGLAVTPSSNNKQHEAGTDLSLASAVKRHVRFVYEQANRNQRRAAKLLDISRATLARHLRNVAQK